MALSINPYDLIIMEAVRLRAERSEGVRIIEQRRFEAKEQKRMLWKMIDAKLDKGRPHTTGPHKANED